MRTAVFRQHSAFNFVASVRVLLLLCGVTAVALYVATNILVPMRYPGYNAASQVVSELSAIDAPTRELWLAMLVPYSVLMVAFGLGVWMSAGKSALLRWVGGILVVGAVIGAFWPPMH